MLFTRAALPHRAAQHNEAKVAVPEIMGEITPRLAGAAATVPDVLDAVPSWLSDVGIVGMIVLFGYSLARNKLFTAGQVDHLITQYEKVAALWEKVATERQETIMLLSENSDPVLKGNEAILRAIEELQRQQELERQFRNWPRNQPEGDWRP